MELVAPHCASHGHVGHYPKGVSVSRRRIRAWPMVMPLLLPQIPALSTRVRSLGSSDSASASEFDTASYEAERKRLDSEARDNMKRAAEAQQSEPEAPGAWKWKIRKRVWDVLEAEGIARNPRPVHHRIPNFVGAEDAADKLGKLPAYRAANCVKVNPDTPQKPVRFMTLRAVKKLLTPQPRLRTGFFSTVDATDLSDRELIEASTTAGVAKFGKPVGLDAKLKVDLVVIGSVAVDPITGARLGKGEGFAELEYGMLRYMGAINDSTLVVTTVHDKQLVNDIPVEKLLIHDVPVDVICTPTQIIHTNRSIPKPTGIYWDRLSPEKLNQIRILQELKKKIEKETGTPLKLGPSEKLPPVAQRKNVSNPRGSGTESGIFIWNLDAKASRKDLKQHLMQLGISTNDIEIFKSGQDSSKNVARVMIPEGADIQWCINTIDNTQLNGVSVRARVDRSQPLRK